MSKTELKKIIKKYSENLRRENFPFSFIYLFGSMVKGTHHKNSDIDVAVITDAEAKKVEKKISSLWTAKRNVDYRIEPHCFSVKDFNDSSDPLVSEIKKTGIRVV
ncbi:MAG: nucleotidyltransferase domain-containing protein [Candidatus Paceibacterota bacterium]|jgi:predicted nucleotidyltransferase